ncbi:MAG: 4-(cytidine 5'-diphospho)-2-C-methyl-D-erythritol kinase [Thermoanaerobaculia bacterium]
MHLSAQAPGKINRELRVGRLRRDGFHEVLSRIVAIDFADDLEVETFAGGLRFTCDGDAPSDESNLVVRAARALATRLGRGAEARIHLKKRIPPGAGLGGGSADAAVALTLLIRLWEAELTAAELASLASGLGSDVPFFLAGGEANVSGRGEQVEPLEDGPATELVLLLPPFAIATSRVYETHRRFPKRSLPDRLEIEETKKYFGPNDLALAVLETDRRMEALMDSAREASNECLISGSGSAIVLRGAGPEAIDELSRRHPEARIIRCRTVSRTEYRRKTGSPGGS